MAYNRQGGGTALLTLGLEEARAVARGAAKWLGDHRFEQEKAKVDEVVEKIELALSQMTEEP